MPTKRTAIFLLIAFFLYLLANQTQVGWVYIISEAFVGLILAAWVYSWNVLKGIGGQRTMSATDVIEENLDLETEPDLRLPTFYEDDPVTVTLTLRNSHFKPAFLLYGQEMCPFAPPSAQILPLFVTTLYKNSPTHLVYKTTCYRRGAYRFSEIPLSSSGPFGFFRRRRVLNIPGDVLIYPFYHPLNRLRIFEKWAFAQRQSLKIGTGSQVVGTRDYRPGDSPRWIHWRSTARTGKLVVKEFSDDEHITLNVLFDLHKAGSLGEGKFSTFETAVRLIATLGYYARHQKMPLRLFGASTNWTPPRTDLSWSALLTYLAKVQNDGSRPLTEVIASLPVLPFVIVLMSNPTQANFAALQTLSRKGSTILVLAITPDEGATDQETGVVGSQLTVKTVTPHTWIELIKTL